MFHTRVHAANDVKVVKKPIIVKANKIIHLIYESISAYFPMQIIQRGKIVLLNIHIYMWCVYVDKKNMYRN